jgi:hypothetical protein
MFKAFKGFGKLKDKPGGASPTRYIAVEEEKKNGNSPSLEELAKKIDGLVSGSKCEEELKPHGPLGELSPEPEDSSRDELTNAVPETEEDAGEKIKVVEMKLGKDGAAMPAAKVAAPAPPPSTDTASAPTSAPAPAPAPSPTPATPSVEGLNNLFRDDEEEENPLANLIRTMPEYTTHEIVEDLNELMRIMREWHKD